jgi:hypothetical protein
MTDSEQQVVEDVLDNFKSEDITYFRIGDYYVVQDVISGRRVSINVDAVRQFCTASELAEYTEYVVEDFMNRIR